jgi:hypothetical protein
VHIGGAGAFDSLILAGILAVLLAELVGETRERLQGGPKSEGRPEDLIHHLREPEPAHKPLEERERPEAARVRVNEEQDNSDTGGDKNA